jgi:hypothetical protein
VLDWDHQITEAPAANLAGLQLADIVCGSFSHAVDKKRYGHCNAKTLQKVMARNARGEIADFGVTAWPRPLNKGKRPLDTQQEEIFRFYGLGRKWLGRPGPTFSVR